MDRDERLRVELVCCAGAGQCDLRELRLADGACVADALALAPAAWQAGLAEGSLVAGVWGRRCTGDMRLRDRDRIEIYRPLQVDPKEARRQRYRRHRQAAVPDLSGNPKR